MGARILTLQPSDDTRLAELMAARQADKGEFRRWLVKADGAWRSLPGDAHECASWERLDHTRGHAVLRILIIVV